MKQYNIDDLIQFAKLGRFGTSDMNNLALNAFLNILRLQQENIELRKKLDEKEQSVNVFKVDASNIGTPNIDLNTNTIY